MTEMKILLAGAEYFFVKFSRELKFNRKTHSLLKQNTELNLKINIMSTFCKIITKILSANPLLLIVAIPIAIMYCIFKDDK